MLLYDNILFRPTGVVSRRTKSNNNSNDIIYYYKDAAGPERAASAAVATTAATRSPPRGLSPAGAPDLGPCLFCGSILYHDYYTVRYTYILRTRYTERLAGGPHLYGKHMRSRLTRIRATYKYIIIQLCERFLFCLFPVVGLGIYMYIYIYTLHLYILYYIRLCACVRLPPRRLRFPTPATRTLNNRTGPRGCLHR